MSAHSISVLMPVANAGQLFLPLCLHSLLTQSISAFEIVAVDCGSTDGSGLMLETAAATDPRVRLIRRPGIPIPDALREAFRKSRGACIAMMPPSAIARSDRLERLAAMLGQGPRPSLCGSWVRLVDADREPLWIQRSLDAADGGTDAPLPFACLMHRELAEATTDWSAWLTAYPPRLPLGREACSRARIVPEPLLDIPVTLAEPGLPGPRADAATVYAHWSHRAADAGFARGARKYARRALIRAPWRRQTWTAVLRAFGA